jgi:hypothetical protein
MANYTYNDRGERIVAVGAPNSMVRLRDEYPVLIEKLQTMEKEEARKFLETQKYHFVDALNKEWRKNLLEVAFPSLMTSINFAIDDHLKNREETVRIR